MKVKLSAALAFHKNSCTLRCSPNKGNGMCPTNFRKQASQEINPTNDQINT